MRRGIAAVVLHVPSQLGFYACDKFQGVEGLGYIIVGAQRQPHDLIHVLDLCSQHDYWEKVLVPDFLADGKSVDVRQHNVQNRKVSGTCPRIPALQRRVELINNCNSRFSDTLRQGRPGLLVVNNKNIRNITISTHISSANDGFQNYNR